MAPIDPLNNNMFAQYTTGLYPATKVGGQEGSPKVTGPKKTEKTQFGQGSAWAGFTGKMLANQHSCFNNPNPTYEASQRGIPAGMSGKALYISA